MEIIFEDENCLVVDKPAGLKVYGKQREDSLLQRLVKMFPQLTNAGLPPRYGLIHRIDKETSGVLLIAKNNETLEFLQNQFRERKVAKIYIGLIQGKMKPSHGVINSYLTRSPQDFRKQKAVLIKKKGTERVAQTTYRTIKSWNHYSLLEISPKTGRMHQIRAHLAWKKHPLAGDPLYRFKDSVDPKNLKRLFLHSQSVSIMMPDQKIKTFQSPLPEELKEVLDYLDKN